MRSLHRKLIRELWQLRGQVLAIALVMTAGIGMMVMALSNHAALSDTRDLYYSEYRFAEVFVQVKRAPLDLVAEIRLLPGVRAVQPRVVAYATLELEDFDDPIIGQLVSLPVPGDPDLNRLFLRRGSTAQADDEVVLGEAFADAHGLQSGDRLTAILNGRRQVLRVAGIGLSPEFVYAIRPGDVFPDFERFGVLWMPRQPLARAFDLDGAFNDLIVGLERETNENELIDRLDAVLASYGGLGAYGRHWQMSHRFLDEELAQLQVMARMFSLIFLVVTAFLLNIVLGRIIASQREQIAVLKAFGYGRGEVALHYGQLALAMVAVGVVPGFLLGLWLGHLLSGVYMVFYSFPYLDWRLQPSLFVLALMFAVAAAGVGTAAALLRVFRLAPAEAMRPEAPPRFRRSLSERLGLGRLLNPAARMILRNLERRPLRTLLSMVGIGLAGGILVMARFQGAAIETMIDVQFGFAERDDLNIALVEPGNLRAAFDLAALPGVLAVEPFRNAAVELRHGHRSYRTALQGLPSAGDLKRVLDLNLRPVRFPEQGIVMTDYLAELLALRPGDRFQIEFLEGRQQQVDVVLAGTVSEYLGVGVYARREIVNRLLDEGEVISGARLAIDPQARQALLHALREAPQVASVADRSATIAGFRDTMARGILTFTLVATLMAASIAIGVVYNAARITLAERGRELASLRVLGYTRGEVRTLLLGELFTLSFLALLPLLLAGWGMAALLVQAFQSDLYRIPLVLPPAGFAFAALAILIATALSGALVRRRVDRLDLVSTLKSSE